LGRKLRAVIEVEYDDDELNPEFEDLGTLPVGDRQLKHLAQGLRVFLEDAVGNGMLTIGAPQCVTEGYSIDVQEVTDADG
jgi:hypothetical protein